MDVLLCTFGCIHNQRTTKNCKYNHSIQINFLYNHSKKKFGIKLLRILYISTIPWLIYIISLLFLVNVNFRYGSKTKVLVTRP